MPTRQRLYQARQASCCQCRIESRSGRRCANCDDALLVVRAERVRRNKETNVGRCCCSCTARANGETDLAAVKKHGPPKLVDSRPGLSFRHRFAPMSGRRALAGRSACGAGRSFGENFEDRSRAALRHRLEHGWGRHMELDCISTETICGRHSHLRWRRWRRPHAGRAIQQSADLGLLRRSGSARGLEAMPTNHRGDRKRPAIKKPT